MILYIWGCPINVVLKVLLQKNVGTMVTTFKIFEGLANSTISTGVKLDKIIFKSDTTFDLCVKFDIFGFLYFWVVYFLTFIS